MPLDNAILEALATAGKLTGVRLVAALRLSADVAASHGSSGGVVSHYGEYRARGVGSGSPSAFRSTAAQRRLDGLLARLHPHERDFLGELLRPCQRPWNALQGWGAGTGYKTADAQRAAGVSRVLCLLDGVACGYGI